MVMTNKPKRIGKFYVNSGLIENGTYSKILSFLEFLPMRVEFLYHMDSLECIGLSNKFDMIERFIRAPEYSIEINNDSENGIKITKL